MSKYFLTLVYLLTLGSIGVYAQDGCDSVNTSLTSKFRYLGDWDSNGRPNYLESERDNVSQALLDYVNEIAPEGEDLHEASPEYFSEEIQLNTVITKSTDVYLTYVHEGAGWKNVLGFYTYPADNPPLTIDDIETLTFIFPNVSKEDEVLVPGDKVHLGRFEEGTVIGYFLMAKGWTGEDACLNSDAHFVFTDKHLNTYTTPEFQQQTILLNYKQENQLLLGIEDIRRPEGDQDFNDAVFYLTSDPIGIDTTNVPEVATATLSGGADLCVGESTDLTVEFTGTGPWSIVYTDGEENTEVENIEDKTYTITTSTTGTYTLVEMRDALGKGLSFGQAEVKNVTPNAEVASHPESICEGENFNVLIDIQNPLGTGTLTYSDGENTFEIDLLEDGQVAIEGLSAGTYELLEISNELCSTELSETITVIANPTPMLAYWDVRCESEEMAVIDVLVEGGTAPYTITYKFDGDLYEVNSDENLVSIEIFSNGNFELYSVRDVNCEGEVEGGVTIIDCLDLINTTSIMTSPTSCQDEEIDLGITISELVDVESVQWSSTGTGFIESTSNLTAVYSPGTGETGTVEITARITVRGETFSVSGTVEILPLPDANFSYAPQTVYTGDQVDFFANDTNLDSYTWIIDEEEFEGSTTSYVFNEAGIYEITLQTISGECISEVTQEISVLLRNALFVPNVFNPTASNPENRVVKVYGNNIEEDGFSFRIFNRWGNELYATNSFLEANSSGWTGVNEGNDEKQGLNTFTYILRGEFSDGTKIDKTGTITLVR